MLPNRRRQIGVGRIVHSFASGVLCEGNSILPGHWIEVLILIKRKTLVAGRGLRLGNNLSLWFPAGHQALTVCHAGAFREWAKISLTGRN